MNEIAVQNMNKQNTIEFSARFVNNQPGATANVGKRHSQQYGGPQSQDHIDMRNSRGDWNAASGTIYQGGGVLLNQESNRTIDVNQGMNN